MIMTRIDRYIIVLYLRVLLICFASVAGLLIVVEVFTNLDEFVRYAESSGKGLALVLLEYFTPRVIDNFEGLSGMLALLAMLFVIAWLNKTNEFTALLAAGVTKRRVVKPLMLASAAVIVAAVIIRELIMPAYADQLQRRPQDLTGGYPRPMRPVYDSDNLVLLRGRHLLIATNEIVEPNFKVYVGGELFDAVGGKILADSAVFQAAGIQSPAGYRFKDVSQPKAIDSISPVISEDGEPVFLTSSQAGWLEPGECFLASTVDYEALRGGKDTKQHASTAELIRYLEAEPAARSGGLRVRVHQRFLRPLIDWTVLLLGIPILLTRADRHVFWIAGACIGIVAGFTVVVLGVAALGGSGNLLSPAVAVWLPLVLFLPWAWARTQNAMET
ncbi:MAG: hypothetical protein Aurels2KO_28920 [Aureliella sp.]